MREPRIADLGAVTAIEIVAANILPEVRRAMLVARRRFEAMTPQEITRLMGECLSTSRELNEVDSNAGRHASVMARLVAMTTLMEVAAENAELLATPLRPTAAAASESKEVKS